MSLPTEPRQKMINIMYLVLTALLALNVSVQILNAFVAVDAGLMRTNKNFDKKNLTTMAKFDAAMAEDAIKTKPFYDKALQVQKLSKDLCNYIDTLKTELKAATDGIPKKKADTLSLMKIEAKDNFDIPTKILINDAASEDGSKGKAHELKMKIRDYRKRLMGLFDPPKDSSGHNIGLKTPDTYSPEEEKVANWEVATFYERPVVAEICLLSQTQNEVKNVESEMENYLLNAVNAQNFKFDKVDPEYIPQSNYVLLGDSFKAKLFVAAYSSTQNPKIIVGDIDTVTGKILGKVDSVKVSHGFGNYAVRTEHEGSVRYSGRIDVLAPDGSLKSYPFHSSYLVAKPAVVISPTKMNVFYINVDNPVEISAPGIPDENLRPSFQGPGSISPASGVKGGFIVRVSSGDGTKCHISVSARMSDGTTKNFPAQEFRIKKVPNPICKVCGQPSDASIAKVVLQNKGVVTAEMENFDFDLHYDVVGFEMVAMSGSYGSVEKSSSGQFTPKMKNIISQMPSGSHIIIAKVHVVRGSDSRVIPGASITVQ